MWLAEECVHSVCIVSAAGRRTTGGSVYLPNSSYCHIMVMKLSAACSHFWPMQRKAFHYDLKPMLLFHRLFMGPATLPLTRRTFLLHFCYSPACCVSFIQGKAVCSSLWRKYAADLAWKALSKNTADIYLEWQCRGIKMKGQMCVARVPPQTGSWAMCFWYMGAIILIWPQLNQVSDLPKLQNYSLGEDHF